MKAFFTQRRQAAKKKDRPHPLSAFALLHDFSHPESHVGGDTAIQVL
jgi:hypothetical protein